MEQAIASVKNRIRKNNRLITKIGKPSFENGKREYMIGYGRNLDADPLSGREISELIHHGFSYPFTSDIRVSFAEYLLDNQVTEAVQTVSAVFGSKFLDMYQSKQEFLIHMVYDLGIKGFMKNKAFINAVNAFDWEVATGLILSYESPMGREALL